MHMLYLALDHILQEFLGSRPFRNSPHVLQPSPSLLSDLGTQAQLCAHSTLEMSFRPRASHSSINN